MVGVSPPKVLPWWVGASVCTTVGVCTSVCTTVGVYLSVHNGGYVSRPWAHSRA